jgi:hypothetical protein
MSVVENRSGKVKRQTPRVECCMGKGRKCINGRFKKRRLFANSVQKECNNYTPTYPKYRSKGCSGGRFDNSRRRKGCPHDVNNFLGHCAKCDGFLKICQRWFSKTFLSIIQFMRKPFPCERQVSRKITHQCNQWRDQNVIQDCLQLSLKL